MLEKEYQNPCDPVSAWSHWGWSSKKFVGLHLCHKQQGKMMPGCMLPPRGNIVPWYQNKAIDKYQTVNLWASLPSFHLVYLPPSSDPLHYNFFLKNNNNAYSVVAISCFQYGQLHFKPWGWHLHNYTHSWIPLKLNKLSSYVYGKSYNLIPVFYIVYYYSALYPYDF